MAPGPPIRHVDRQPRYSSPPGTAAWSGATYTGGMVQKYPEIQVVSRDRGGIYALAARDGAPQAIQVADRWHLLKNIGDALERMMYRHMPLIRLVATELSPKNKTPNRLWHRYQHYVALRKLNNSGVTGDINAGLRSTLFIKKVAGSEKYHASPDCPGRRFVDGYSRKPSLKYQRNHQNPGFWIRGRNGWKNSE